MKLRFIHGIAGVHYLFRPKEIGVIEDKAEALRLIEAGIAVPVIEEADVAVTPAPVEIAPTEPEKRGKKK
jgi:hypothetical protein